MLPSALEAIPLVAELQSRHPGAILDGKLDRAELTLVIQPDAIVAVCRHLKQQGFTRLSSITAVDWHPSQPRFEVVYHLHSLDLNQRLRLKCPLEEPAEIDSLTGVWRGADWYEREVWDLFGIRFRNHPNLKRILLPEDWTDHPLRKDFPVHGRRYDYAEEEA